MELTQRLIRKWPECEHIDVVVSELVDENLLSDERYCEAFVRSRQAKLQGPLKIRAGLQAKGVARQYVSAAMAVPDEIWVDLATEWLSRQRFEGGSTKEKARYYRRLMNRGFSHSQAMGAIDASIG